MGGQTTFTLAATFSISYGVVANVPVRVRVRQNEVSVDQIKDKEKQYFIDRHFIPREDVENG